MSFFNFRNQNKFKAIAQILSHNEQVSKHSLHEKHPHTRDIFARHNIDLQQIRRQSVKAATAATILGAFLAFPHLLGHPANETKNQPDLKTLSTEKQLEQPKETSFSKNHQLVNPSPGINTHLTAHPNLPTAGKDDEKESHGHTHGRSYLAPPKEHGFHDLGLHKGEDKDKGKAESPGPHPEDLEINHAEKEQ